MFFPTQFPWAKDQSLGEHLEASGVSRRDFLEFCGQMAVLLGLTEMAAPRVAAALEGVKRPMVIWIQLQECTGCVESVLRTADPTIGDLVLDIVSLDYSAHAHGGGRAPRPRQALADSMKANTGKYLLVVTGSVPLDENGIYTTIGGRTAKDDPGGGGAGRRGGHRGRRLRPLGQRPGRAAQPHRRGGRVARSSRTSRW